VLRGAPDQHHPISVGPNEPESAIGNERVEFELIVDNHVEGDVDDVAVIAAQIVPPASRKAADERDSAAASAAQRPDQRAAQNRPEIDRKDAEAKQ
jgi:hypothetical protein